MASEMRELEKIQEKVEIRVDTHEITWLVVACILIAGGVFSTGFYVGADSRPTPTREIADILVDDNVND